MPSHCELALEVLQTSAAMAKSLAAADVESLCALIAQRQLLIEQVRKGPGSTELTRADLSEIVDLDGQVMDFLRQAMADVDASLAGCRRWVPVMQGYSGDESSQPRFIDRRS